MRPAVPASLAFLLLLAACGRGEEGTTPAPPPPPAAPAPAPPVQAIDFTRSLNLLGNEPFWSLRIRPDGLTFSAPDKADVTAPNPGPAVSGPMAVWSADARGQPVTATLNAEVCQDGMSGLLYPFKATVEIDGATLQGCAAYADAMPREG